MNQVLSPIRQILQGLQVSQGAGLLKKKKEVNNVQCNSKVKVERDTNLPFLLSVLH